MKAEIKCAIIVPRLCIQRRDLKKVKFVHVV